MVWNETERHWTGLDRMKGFETRPVVIGRKWTGEDWTGRERDGEGRGGMGRDGNRWGGKGPDRTEISFSLPK